MEKILFINACVRPQSRTRRLAACVLEALQKKEGGVQEAMNPETVNPEEVNLEKEAVPALTGETLALRDCLSAEGNLDAPMFRYARQFAEADVIVVAAPYWDLSFPASLKAYIEAITVTGVTFHYTPEGVPAGLCRAKQLIYVTTAGGFIGENDFGFSYLKTMAQTFYGIQNVTCIRAEGLDIVGMDGEAILRKAEEEIRGASFL